jgi:hypothetical protein
LGIVDVTKWLAAGLDDYCVNHLKMDLGIEPAPLRRPTKETFDKYKVCSLFLFLFFLLFLFRLFILLPFQFCPSSSASNSTTARLRGSAHKSLGVTR